MPGRRKGARRRVIRHALDFGEPALATQVYNRDKTSGLVPKNGKNFTRSNLAISGGGDDGAFDAGLLAGWSAPVRT